MQRPDMTSLVCSDSTTSNVAGGEGDAAGGSGGLGPISSQPIGGGGVTRVEDPQRAEAAVPAGDGRVLGSLPSQRTEEEVINELLAAGQATDGDADKERQVPASKL